MCDSSATQSKTQTNTKIDGRPAATLAISRRHMKQGVKVTLLNRARDANTLDSAELNIETKLNI